MNPTATRMLAEAGQAGEGLGEGEEQQEEEEELLLGEGLQAIQPICLMAMPWKKAGVITVTVALAFIHRIGLAYPIKGMGKKEREE